MLDLLIIRHAKSFWEDPGVEDFNRKLNDRGKNDLKFMPVEIKLIFPKADLILFSPSKRTYKTFLKIQKKVEWDAELEAHHLLYLADLETLLLYLKKVSDKFKRVVIIGHNPGLTDLINFLQKDKIENLPTLGVCHIQFRLKSWKNLKKDTGLIKNFIYPKQFKELQ